MIFDVADLPEGAKLRLAGADLFILHEPVPENQLWLDLPGCFIYPVSAEEEPRDTLRVHSYNLKKLANMAGRPHARTGPEERRLYKYRRDQYVLPFVEGRRVSHNEMGRLQNAGYPGWERLPPDGRLAQVTIFQSKAKEAISWVDEHCSGRVNIGKSRTLFTFEKATEAAMFKMLFSVEWKNG